MKEQIVPDGYYWLDCIIEEMPIMVHGGEMLVVRLTDGEIMKCGHVNNGVYTAKSFRPRQEGDT